MAIPQYVCATCGYKDKPDIYMRGSTKIEIVLWLIGIIPGFIYTAWRRKTAVMVCPHCETASMISTKSPHGSHLAGY